MSLFLRSFLSAAVDAAFTALPAYATQPGQTVRPDGFPSGEHYHLNILGNKNRFVCEQQYDYQGNPVCGNVFFAPLNGDSIY